MTKQDDDDLLRLMKRHGDPVDHKNRFGWVYQFSVADMHALIADWLALQARRAKRRTDKQDDFFL